MFVPPSGPIGKLLFEASDVVHFPEMASYLLSLPGSIGNFQNSKVLRVKGYYTAGSLLSGVSSMSRV